MKYTRKEFHNHVFKVSTEEFDKKFLLKNIGKKCIKKGYWEITPIEWAALCGHLKVVKYLHKNGVDVTAGCRRAIQWAAEFGHLEVVKYLHENGIDITASCNWAMQWSAKNGHLKVVKYLYENSVDITCNNNFAIKWAAENSHLEVVKYILDTFILTKETVANIAIEYRKYIENKEVLDLLQNYKQFSNTKAVK